MLQSSARFSASSVPPLVSCGSAAVRHSGRMAELMAKSSWEVVVAVMADVSGGAGLTAAAELSIV